MGWKENAHCFYKLKLNDNIMKNTLMFQQKINKQKKIKYFRKYISNFDDLNFIDPNLKVAIITPDKDIVPDAQTLHPAYIVFDNYEIILKWNRSLRFALAVCTLKEKN